MIGDVFFFSYKIWKSQKIMLYLKCKFKLIIDMKKNNSKMNSSEDILTAINEDNVLKTVCRNLCYTAIKIAKYIDKFESIMKDNEGDADFIPIEGDASFMPIIADNFTDIEKFYIGGFKDEVIYIFNKYKPQYELINIWMVDDIVIFKVKV